MRVRKRGLSIAKQLKKVSTNTKQNQWKKNNIAALLVPDPCSLNPIPDLCLSYCQQSKLTAEQEAFIIDIHNMSIANANEDVGLASRNGIPLCNSPAIFTNEEKPRHTSAQCWKRVVTDKGICHANLLNKVSSIVGTGPSTAYSFLIDNGEIYAKETMNRHYYIQVLSRQLQLLPVNLCKVLFFFPGHT